MTPVSKCRAVSSSVRDECRSVGPGLKRGLGSRVDDLAEHFKELGPRVVAHADDREAEGRARAVRWIAIDRTLSSVKTPASDEIWIYLPKRLVLHSLGVTADEASI